MRLLVVLAISYTFLTLVTGKRHRGTMLCFMPKGDCYHRRAICCGDVEHGQCCAMRDSRFCHAMMAKRLPLNFETNFYSTEKGIGLICDSFSDDACACNVAGASCYDHSTSDDDDDLDKCSIRIIKPGTQKRQTNNSLGLQPRFHGDESNDYASTECRQPDMVRYYDLKPGSETEYTDVNYGFVEVNELNEALSFLLDDKPSGVAALEQFPSYKQD